jgi:hypothetical protein
MTSDDTSTAAAAAAAVDVVLIPHDQSQSLQIHRLSIEHETSIHTDKNEEGLNKNETSSTRSSTTTTSNTTMPLRQSIESLLLLNLKSSSSSSNYDETSEIPPVSPSSLTLTSHLETPLIRPNIDKPSCGLYAYFLPQMRKKHETNHRHLESCHQQQSLEEEEEEGPEPLQLPPNIRATRLAMSCGLFSSRFYGPVLLVRCQYVPRVVFKDLTIEDLYFACEVSPDLRYCPSKLMPPGEVGGDSSSTENAAAVALIVPDWLASAASQNYHDASAISRMAKIFTNSNQKSSSNSDHSDNDEDDDDSTEESNDDSKSEDVVTGRRTGFTHQIKKAVVAKTPLCLNCRRPTNHLCPGCEGAYFCHSSSSEQSSSSTALSQKDCRTDGWSHLCLCSTWKRYTDRRIELSTFAFFEDDWQSKLVQREFQVSEKPYEDWLKSRGFLGDNGDRSNNDCSASSSWWVTETHGWAGGRSDSARQVDARSRKSYSIGFAPLSVSHIPPQRRVTDQDWERAGLATPTSINEVGLRKLSSWEQYYRLRDIPSSSPVALLCTFPLTVYYAIVQYGAVPITVAKIMKRPLKIHVVGAEKELHLLDLFQEVAFLLPVELRVEMVMVVRKDMLPPAHQEQEDGENDSQLLLRVDLASNLTAGIATGSYGDESSLLPNFDLGNMGPPDMIIALNAGLFAYDSWRSVVEYLDHNRGVVGVFTDYNEHSGLNCASLGGIDSRKSLVVNPFRQPLAMPGTYIWC